MQTEQPLVTTEAEPKPVEPIQEIVSPAVPTPAATFDEVPIGGGNKFNFSEFPEEGSAPKPVKKVVPKRNVKKQEKKQDTSQAATKKEVPANESNQNGGSTLTGSNDQKPVGRSNPLDELPVGGNTANMFDEKPIGKSNFTMSQYPTQEGAPVETQSSYTMAQKLASKAAKTRLSGLEDLLELLNTDPNSPDLEEVPMHNLLKETTPLNMEKILQCLKVWLDKGRSWGEDIARNAIENGYINGKANCKKLTVDLVVFLYGDKAAIIEMTILLGFKSKTPKIIAGYLAMVNELLAIYGIRKMKYLKPYFAQVVRVVSTEKQASVKTEGYEVLKNAHKWLGKEVVDPMIDKLPDAMKKELEKFWESYDKTTVMTAPKDVPDQGQPAKAGKKIDAYDLSEAVDIFKKFNQKWSDELLKKTKWNERTAMMEEFVKEASTPKIANTQFRHITDVIKRLINDSNFNVVLWDLRMIGVLSRGLRRQFYPVAKLMFDQVIAKFRDKKTQMIDETFKTLGDLMYSISLEEVLDDVKKGLTDKAPNMKVNLINWIGKFVEAKAEEKGDLPPKAKEALKELFPEMQKLLGDGTADVRDCMAKNIGKMKLLIGEDFFAALQKNMNKNLASKAQIDPKEAAKKNETARSSVGSKTPAAVVNMKLTQSRLGSTQTGKRESLAEKQEELECFEEPTFEGSIAELVSEGFPQEEANKIVTGGAKERGNILTIMCENPYSNLNCMLRVLKKAFKDWKQVNLVMNKELVQFLKDRCSEFGKPETYVILPFIIEKVGDSKFTEPLLKTVESICRRVPGNFIVGHIIKYIRSTEGKKPKLNSDACVLISKVMENISIKNIPLRQTIDYAKESYAVEFSKKGAVDLLVVIYSYIGPSIKTYLDETTYASLEPQFKEVKVLNEEQKQSRVTFEGEAAQQAKRSSMNESAIQKSQKRVKVDITAEVLRLLPLMNNNNWEKRRDSAEALTSIIVENDGRVTITCVHDLVATLKTRINDPNKSLIKTFVHLTGLVFGSINDRDLKNYAKTFIGLLAEGFSDKSEANRKQIHATINKIGDAMGKEQLLSCLGPFLEGEKESRVEVVNLILANEEWLPRADVRDYPKGLVSCLCDKNKEVRAQSEKLFEKIYEKIGMETFRQIAKDQRPAFVKDLNAFFNRFDKAQSVFSSKKVSPAKNPEKEKRLSTTVISQPPSAKKRSLSKTNLPTASPDTLSQDAMTSMKPNNLVIGDEYFAPIKVLASQRIERQESDLSNPWRLDQIKQSQEDELREQINRLFRPDLAMKLQSFDNKRVLDAVIQLIKLCKDLTYQGHIRELYDILMKWTFIRLWGGNPALLNIIELLPPMISILEKRKLPLNDLEIDLVLAVIRQYFISVFLNQFKVSESLYSIIRCLIILSSGEKVLRKILKQFSIEISSIHRHIKREATVFYRDGLSKLVKTQLMEYVGNQDTLEQASKIKQLKNDQEFVGMLQRRFNENVFHAFGFRKPNSNSPHFGGKGDQQKERSFDGQRVSSSSPSEYSKNLSQTQTYMQGDDARRSMNIPNIPSPIQTKKTPPVVVSPTPNRGDYRTDQSRLSESNAQNTVQNQRSSRMQEPQERKFDLSSYPAPHPASPLAKNLGKLLPPNEATVSFFSALFSENGQKIAHELQVHAKVIFGSILKSVQDMLQRRKDYAPEKLINQIDLLQKCIKCKFIIRHVGELIYYGTNFALMQLVYEDENKNLIAEDLRNRNSECKTENFIRVINGVMLRILENGNSQEVVIILFQLLIVQLRATKQSQKTINLIVKCITRVSPNFVTELKIEKIVDFMLRINEYLGIIGFEIPLEEFKIPANEKPKTDQSVINAIKEMLAELVGVLGSQIWEYYDKAAQSFLYQDEHISKYIVSLKIRRPQIRRSSVHRDDQLRKINQLLSKNRSFDNGIEYLKQYIANHPEFNIVAYFQNLNYDEKFIDMVMEAISSNGNYYRKTPRKDRDKSNTSRKASSNVPPEIASQTQLGNIQDKIKQLRQKYQQAPEQASERAQNRDVKRISQNKQIQQKEERSIEIQRRINDMKSRMNTAVHIKAKDRPNE